MRVENIVLKDDEGRAFDPDEKRQLVERKTALTPELAIPYAMRELIEQLATLRPEMSANPRR
jgi:hypothetical protein